MSGKKKTGIKTVICSILALILVFFGVVVVCGSIGLKDVPQNTKDLPLEKITAGNMIYCEELSVIAPYMYSGTDDMKTVHMLVSFPDPDGTMCIASLTVREDSDIYDFLQTYVENDQAGVGSYAIKGYFLVSEVRYLGGQMTAYYNNACEKYGELMQSGSELYYNGKVYPTEFDLKYICAEGENPAASESGANTSSMIIGIVIVLAGVIGIAATVLNIVVETMEKKKKQAVPPDKQERQI